MTHLRSQGGGYSDEGQELLERLRADLRRLEARFDLATPVDIDRLQGEYDRLSRSHGGLYGLAEVEGLLAQLRMLARWNVLRNAFDTFVSLVKPINQVRYVIGFDSSAPEVFTLIDKRDEAVCRAVFEAEDRIVQAFPRLDLDFHITYLEGRPLEAFFAPPPSLFFARETGNAH